MRVKRRRARLAAAGACALAALVLAGCHAKATVAIRMHRDGSGIVAVDVALDHAARLALVGAELKPSSAAANAALPDVPLTDLRAHGWTVSSWKQTHDGGAALSLSKPFAGRGGLAAVLAEVDGRDGALRDVKTMRTRSLLRDRDSVSLLADLGHLDAGVAGDTNLAARLRTAGVDVAAIDKGLQSRIGGAFDLSVTVSLPDGRHAAIHLVPGDRRRIVAATDTRHSGRLAALVGAGAGACVGLILFAIASVKARRARRT